MREKLVRSDAVECVIGLAANLFYNSPMEACIVICRGRNAKPKERVGKILFINAVHEVTRKNAESNLEDRHIRKIADAYEDYQDIDGFAKIATIREIEDNDFSLSIPLYVKPKRNSDEEDSRTFEDLYESWTLNTSQAHQLFNYLNNLIR
jgi:type I restriction enzyme M protein